ncbi:NAD-dependent malic enzyme [Alkalihalobacillus oceani]|uniref:NAD(P)-dependent malic enzyme n=1 Tax=Halalkalibacter oceani TaxID=1653776 RepID=UPI002040C855|nr:malic enzyme-like NAD(P)-binding protein [Halalkalibacter oceani]MCM3760398.1 NAD-dependent malic enzyme [Halalkalibacter oceani]
MQSIRERALDLHKQTRGKLDVNLKVALESMDDLSLAYSPGVAEPCKEIHLDEEKIYEYTIKGNLVGVISDGSSVLGLGNIGGGASMPVMEGKAALFKAFADIDAFPICLNVQDPEQIIAAVKAMEPTFGGINLEDISAPNCFLIEERLKEEMNIPVFHDDQHGTAIVSAAGLINALKYVNKQLEDVTVVVNGAGAAGIAITNLLLNLGIGDLILCDSKGIIEPGRQNLNEMKTAVAKRTNKQAKAGKLAEAVRGADVFIGVSVAGALTQEMVRSMERDAIIFAMANPEPEIMPEQAKEAGAVIIGTGRSDLPNQVNNVLAFPGIFKGALEVRASEINEEMKIAAVYAIANLITSEELTPEYIIPNAFDKRVVESVAGAVANAAMKTNVARHSMRRTPVGK